MIRIGIVGFGTIGKRVADAVSKQDDMKLVGIVKVRPDYRAQVAVAKGYKLYVPKERVKEFEAHGIEVTGTIEELLGIVDVVVDATPAGVGSKNKDMYYKRSRVKVIFQGGEEAGVADVSFNALANYEDAINARYVRVVSCNTTAICRIIKSLLLNDIDIRAVRVFIVRRGADPHEHKKGPINDVVLDPPTIPSHHAADVKTVIPDIDIVTTAIAIPVTIGHIHFMYFKLRSKCSADRVLEALYRTPRILLFESRRGFVSIAQVIEWARDLGRLRADVPENIVFRDSVKVQGDELILTMAVHQESIVVPENIDAIRAVTGFRSKWDSIRKTDLSLGLVTEGKRYG